MYNMLYNIIIDIILIIYIILYIFIILNFFYFYLFERQITAFDGSERIQSHYDFRSQHYLFL